jgi:hypothetical protein
MTPEQRIAELATQRADALAEENARLREFNEVLLAAIEHQTGLRLPRAGGRQPCQVPVPPRHARRLRDGEAR